MIPTTVSSSPSTAAASGGSGSSSNSSGSGNGNGGGGGNSSSSSSSSSSSNSNSNSPGSGFNTSSNSSNNIGQIGQQNSLSVMIGLASLVLEGRAVADENFQPPHTTTRANNIIDGSGPSGFGSGSGIGGAFNHNTNASNTSSGISGSGCVGGGSGSSSSGSGNIFSAGRQSPTCRPSTSRAAASYGGHVINITTNPCAFPSVGVVAGGSHVHEATSPLYIDSYTASNSASSSAESTHQRWTQKLCQLRQISPAASLSSTYEQPLAVEAREPEVVALALNESGASERGEFEIVRRSLLNRSNLAHSSGMCSASPSAGAAGSVSSSPGSSSENFLLSLQTLATTRLRSGSPSMESGSVGGGCGGVYRYSTLSSSPLAQSMYVYRTATPVTHRFLDAPNSGSSSGSGIQSPRPNWPALGVAATATNINNPIHSKDKFMRHTTAMTTAATPPLGRPCVPNVATNWPYGTAMSTATAATHTARKVTTTAASSSTYPQQGPHCDQFLKKMGLAKGEAAEAEDHFCDMSYVNITCSRWRAYCHKMETIIGRGEPVCIEVYLGPVNHKILLEQWIITQKEKVPPPTMTLPSLCSAIRSQLYFSQISAWCDLIKKSDKTIYDTGRIIFPTPTGAAGDLATPSASAANAAAAVASAAVAAAAAGSNNTPGTSPTTAALNQLGNIMLNRRPRLNIFYRIKSFDATACFNSKPNVHNFPNVNISENCSISVCLKSLPRINGGIPKVGTLIMSTAPTTLTTTTATTATATIHDSAMSPSPPSMATASANGSSSNGVTSHYFSGSSNKCSSNGHGSNISNRNNNNSGNNLNETPRSSRNSRIDIQMSSSAAVAGKINTNNCDMGKPRAFAAISSSSTGCPASGEVPLANSSSTTSASSCSSATTATSNGNSNSVSSSSVSQVSGHKHKCMFFIDEEELLGDEGEFCIAAEEDDNPSDTANSTGDSTASTSAFSSSANMSHREKQLLKYRKRMMKRDKKHQHQRKPLSTTSDASCELGAVIELQRQQHERNERKALSDRHNYQPMEEGDEESCDAEVAQSETVTYVSSGQIEMISTGTQTPMTCCQHCGREKTLICLKCSRDGVCDSALSQPPQITIPTDLDIDEMDDSASSISSSEIIHTPRNKAELLLQAIQRTPKVAKYKKQTLRESNASANGSIVSCNGNSPNSSVKLQNNNHLSGAPVTNGQLGGSSVAASSPNDTIMNGSTSCQVCKRQKTQHNFDTRNGSGIAKDAELITDEDDGDGGRISELFQQDNGAETKRLFVVGEDEEEQQMETLQQSPTSIQQETIILPIRTEIMEEETFSSSTKLTPHIDRCSLSSTDRAGGDSSNNKISNGNKSNRCCTPPIVTLVENGTLEESQFKTPTTAGSCFYGQQQPKPQNLQSQSILQPVFQHKQTPKPNLLQISCTYHGENMHAAGAAGDGFGVLRCNNDLKSLNYVTTPSTLHQKQQQQTHHNSLLLRKGLPKVNLTPIFCNPIPAATITSSHSSPIPIHGATQDATFLFDTSAINRSNTTSNPSLMHSSSANANANINANTTDNNIPVQKSYSAPTLPNSPSLSPRFAKQAAIYKRRSRHLSDRSDRSSLGSDEQFSDEDLEGGGIYSPATSPLKQRTRVAAAFGRQPLLGNLEESLLQKRLMPKVEVMGFKVLLGASGGFCPTQLTIPASAYFYELHGESLSTPYVCDIRLPRKGYSVPRAGTVQATLLNPMGTVVRMFVIPYDMRDMPPLHQTFIRQRILADASTNEATENASTIASAMNGQQSNGCKSGQIYLNSFTNNESANHATGNNNNNNNDCFVNNNKDGCSNNNNSSNAGNKYRLSPSGGLHGESNLGHFISPEHMKRLRYSIHLRFQTSRSGRLSLHTDIRLLISRRTDCDTAAAHAKGVLEAPNDLVTDTVMPTNPKYSARQEGNINSSSKI